MKINWKSIGITMGLLIVLCGVVLVEISLFISGPARRHEDVIATQMERIKDKYKNIQDLERHVFKYTTYVGEDVKKLVWFNEKGTAIVSKKKSSLEMEKARNIAKERYHAQDIVVSIGYGYDNPVYIITCDQGSILLDYDTMKEVYFLKEGDA